MNPSIGQNSTSNTPWVLPAPAQNLGIETPPSAQEVTQNASSMVRDIAMDLFKPNQAKQPPQPNQATGIMGKFRSLTKLGINNILVPITKELFKRNAELALQSPELTPEEKVKIETAKYASAAALTQGAVSLVTQEVHKRIIQTSTEYKLRPNALPLALQTIALIEKYGSFSEQAIKELYEKGELFYNAFNDPKTLDQSLSLVVRAVDDFMDQARGELNTPGPKMQEQAKETLKLADLAIAAESATRSLQVRNKKYDMYNVRLTAIA